MVLKGEGVFAGSDENIETIFRFHFLSLRIFRASECILYFKDYWLSYSFFSPHFEEPFQFVLRQLLCAYSYFLTSLLLNRPSLLYSRGSLFQLSKLSLYSVLIRFGVCFFSRFLLQPTHSLHLLSHSLLNSPLDPSVQATLHCQFLHRNP